MYLSGKGAKNSDNRLEGLIRLLYGSIDDDYEKVSWEDNMEKHAKLGTSDHRSCCISKPLREAALGVANMTGYVGGVALLAETRTGDLIRCDRF